MKKRSVLVLFMAMMTLAACGGQPEPAAQDSAVSSTDSDVEVISESSSESAAEPTAAGSDESPGEETGASSEEAEETPEENTEAGDEAEGDMVAGRPASGTDPETGLAINPEVYAAGEEFIVRGRILSMTLTPTTAPEFLIEAPSGRRYRMRSQDLAQTFFDDGTQIRPHEYRQGMLVQATVAFPPGAGPTDILRSENLTLLHEE